MEVEIHVGRPYAEAQQRLVEDAAPPAENILENDAEDAEEKNHLSLVILSREDGEGSQRPRTLHREILRRLRASG
jgi:hypothetical protein